MIDLKDQQAITAMRTGGKILASILTELKNACQVGMSTLDLDKIAEQLFAKHNVIASFKGHRGFPGSICTTRNQEVVHGIPTAEAIIQQGDLITIDAGVYHQGYHTDSAVSFAVGPVPKRTQELINETENALWAGIDQVKPGNRIGDISFAIEQHLKKHQITVIPELIGHGIGKTLHEPPQVPNTGKKHSGPVLKPGMTFAIEPITCLGKRFIETLSDDWTIVTSDGSLSCQQEHTVLVTATGVEVLTDRR